MKIKSVPKSILSVIIVLWSGSLTAAQDNELPMPGIKSANNVPPPGLVVSIDMGVPVVLTVGIGMGIYFLRRKKPTA